MSTFQENLKNLDITLFQHVESQSTNNDKHALLALHQAARDIWGQFRYLEIGSHLGGSLQVLVVDDACSHIGSIDPRPVAFADERGIVSRYPSNSTDRMLSLLRAIPGARAEKITTFESDTASLIPADMGTKYHFCFIDGEHTDVAVLRDSKFCLGCLEEGGYIAYHDANVVYQGIADFIQHLESIGLKYQARLLPDAVFVIEIGSNRLFSHSAVAAEVAQSWRGYIFGLSSNAWYRAVMNKPLFRFLRQIRFIRRLFVVKGMKAQPI